MTFASRFRVRRVLALCAGLLLPLAALAAPIRFDIPAQSAVAGLDLFARQSGAEVMFDQTQLAQHRCSEVHGELEPEAALGQLLQGTGYIAKRSSNGKFMVAAAEKAPSDPNAPRAALTSDRPAEKSEKIEDNPTKLEAVKVLGKFEVMESKLLNMDKPRTVDDPQPYVVFDRITIERSGAVDVEDFLKTRLTMNTTAQVPENNLASNTGSVGAVNLHGLGLGQTLILIDGHRTATMSQPEAGAALQGDLSAVPIGAIERIEVLPSTSSGIYGGGATGGVVNVILRRDYQGLETTFTYRNSFATDSAVRSVSFAAGLTLENGRTNLLLSGSYTDQNQLRNQDRDFVTRGRAAVMRNNPGYYSSQTSVPGGSTPNVRSSTGANLVLKNGTPLNSFYTYVPHGYAGPASDGGAALVANAGKYNLDLSPTTLSASSAGLDGAYAVLLNPTTTASFTLSARRQIRPWLQGFVEGSATDKLSAEPLNSSFAVFTLAATAATNPFTTAVRVRVPDNSFGGTAKQWTQNRRVVAGLVAKLPGEWMAETDFTWGATRQAYIVPAKESTVGAAALAAGKYDVLRDTIQSPLNITGTDRFDITQYTTDPFGALSRDWSVRFSGPVGSLPGGKPTLSTLLEYRDDVLTRGEIFSAPSLVLISPDKKQAITSAYVEFLTPFVSERNAGWYGRGLSLQVAGRFDRYLTDGADALTTPGATAASVGSEVHSANPTVAVRYQPVRDLAFRASYGTGFLAPNPSQILPSPSSPPVFGNRGTDPRRGNETVVADARAGGNANLLPEKSKGVAIGLIFTPRFVPGLRLSLDYTRTKKTDNIINMTTQQLIDNEAYFPSRVVRGPKLPTDSPAWPGPITFLDYSTINAASAMVEAYDGRIDYALKPTSLGQFDFFAGATRTTHFRTQLLPLAPVVENVGFGIANWAAATNSPLRLKMSGGASWTHRALTLGWNFDFASSYLAYLATDSATTKASTVANQGNGEGRVPSQIYHDVYLKYRFTGSSSAFWNKLSDRTELSVGVRNIFNAEPPFDARNTQIYASYYGDPRLSTYYLRVRKSF